MKKFNSKIILTIYFVFASYCIFSQNINGKAIYWGSGSPMPTGTIVKIVGTNISYTIQKDGIFLLPYVFKKNESVTVSIENAQFNIYTTVKVSNYNPFCVKAMEKNKIRFPEEPKKIKTTKGKFYIIAANTPMEVNTTELSYFGGESAFKNSPWSQEELEKIGLNVIFEAGVLVKGYSSSDIYLTKDNIKFHKVTELQKQLYFCNNKVELISELSIKGFKDQKLIVNSSTDEELLRNVNNCNCCY
jgi:hypothetical protein